MGWGSSTRRGGGRKLRARPRNFVFLGFRIPWVSKRGIRDVPEILPGCPGPLAVFKKFVQKNFVLICRSLWKVHPPQIGGVNLTPKFGGYGFVRLSLRARWPSTEWETGPAPKSAKNGKKMENGPRPEMAEKWPPKRKNGPKKGFWPFFLYFFHFGGHFSAISGRGPFSIFFPIFFPIFCGFWCRTGFPFCRWPPRTQA